MTEQNVAHKNGKFYESGNVNQSTVIILNVSWRFFSVYASAVLGTLTLEYKFDDSSGRM